jgi:hypothetical protein
MIVIAVLYGLLGYSPLVFNFLTLTRQSGGPNRGRRYSKIQLYDHTSSYNNSPNYAQTETEPSAEREMSIDPNYAAKAPQAQFPSIQRQQRIKCE